MAIPIASQYPTAYDDDTTLLGNPVNQIVLTLVGDLSTGATTIPVLEDISSLNVPLFFVFETGEIVYAEGKDDGLKQLSSVTRSNTPQGHNDGELIYVSLVAQHFTQPKRAILAIQSTLGLDPQGGAATVAARLQALSTDLAALEASISALDASLDVAETRLDAAEGDEYYASLEGYTGQILMFAGTSVPSGWLECDGAEIDRTTYARLFSVLGVAFGSTSGSTFKLPDLRGRVIVGGMAIGSSGGEEEVTIDWQTLAPHTHTLSQVNPNHMGITNRPFTDWKWEYLAPQSNPLAFTQYTGGYLPHNNMQPYAVLKYIIKT
jgi:microcystin-dependent protein